MEEMERKMRCLDSKWWWGEQQRSNGQYLYIYKGKGGKNKFVYSWRLEPLPLERVEKRSFYFFFTLFGGLNMRTCGKIYEEPSFWGRRKNLENIRKNQDIPRYKEIWKP